jgi:hypothetical protein
MPAQRRARRQHRLPDEPGQDGRSLARRQHHSARYDAAGVRKFAFHMPEGMPMIGQPPQNEAPGRFPTGYVGKREEALAWLAG